jgi:MYXO-CTERM domain-containing protein
MRGYRAGPFVIDSADAGGTSGLSGGLAAFALAFVRRKRTRQPTSTRLR